MNDKLDIFGQPESIERVFPNPLHNTNGNSYIKDLHKSINQLNFNIQRALFDLSRPETDKSIAIEHLEKALTELRDYNNDVSTYEKILKVNITV